MVFRIGLSISTSIFSSMRALTWLRICWVPLRVSTQASRVWRDHTTTRITTCLTTSSHCGLIAIPRSDQDGCLQLRTSAKQCQTSTSPDLPHQVGAYTPLLQRCFTTQIMRAAKQTGASAKSKTKTTFLYSCAWPRLATQTQQAMMCVSSTSYLSE